MMTARDTLLISDVSMGLSKPAQRALTNAGISSLDDLAKWSESDVLELHGMGPKAMNRVRHALANKGLSFANQSRRSR